MLRNFSLPVLIAGSKARTHKSGKIKDGRNDQKLKTPDHLVIRIMQSNDILLMQYPDNYQQKRTNGKFKSSHIICSAQTESPDARPYESLLFLLVIVFVYASDQKSQPEKCHSKRKSVIYSTAVPIERFGSDL